MVILIPVLPAWMIDAITKQAPADDQRIPAQIPMPDYAPPADQGKPQRQSQRRGN
jgi:hypothetical protein